VLGNPEEKTKANAFGLYDMHGNVNEWCLDFMQGSDDRRIHTGGSYNDDISFCAIGEDDKKDRLGNHESKFRGYQTGFRPVKRLEYTNIIKYCHLFASILVAILLIPKISMIINIFIATIKRRP